jgi:hypothetical protein
MRCFFLSIVLTPRCDLIQPASLTRRRLVRVPGCVNQYEIFTHSQVFTAPAVIPLMIFSESRTKRTKVGKNRMIIPANIPAQFPV